MNERISKAVKAPEAKSKNSAPKTQRKTDHSQSMNSSVDRVLYLQRTIGNQAVGRLIRSEALQTKLKIGPPGDKYEREADRVADQVMRMRDIEVSAKTNASNSIQGNSIQLRRPGGNNGTKSGKGEEEETLQKKEASSSTPEVTPKLESSISAVSAGGQPLPESVRAFHEPRFGVDFSQVRMHTGSQAAETVKSINAKAFTVGHNIAFGGGQFAPESKDGQRLIAHELTHTIQQGHAIQRSPQISMTVTAPLVQGDFSLSDLNPLEALVKKATDYISKHAEAVPGFTMLTVVMGKNPLTGATVDRSPGNILKGAIEMIPGGSFVTEALNNHGIFDKVSAWASEQFNTLKAIGSNIWQDIKNFIKNFSITDLGDLEGVWERAKNIVTAPIAQIKSFATGLKNDIVTFVKDAILKPIAAYAKNNTNGYPLLCAVMGKDPISGEVVPSDANALLGGFMKFIGEEETWTNMQKANAVPRAFAWFKNAINEVKGFVNEIPGLFIAAFKALDIMDIVLIPKAFIKLAKVFVNFAGRFISWGLNAVWNLLEIIFDSLKPGLMGYIKRTGAALKSILKNPLPFAGNLVRAAVQGFKNFANNIGTHLKAGLIDWLTGSLTGVYIPKALSLSELGKFALSVLGITWAQIRGKIVKALGPTGEKIMKALETGFDLIVALVTGGPAAAWEWIKEKLSDLKDTIVGGIISFVTETVAKKAVPKLIAMFIPGAGFISAISSIYDTFIVFKEKMSKIAQVVTAFIDSIVTIAAGNIGAATSRVESILAGLISLAISFLAGFVGLGKVTDKIKEVIEKVRGAVDKALDWVINTIVGKAKAWFAKLFGGKDKEDKEKKPDERTDEQKQADLDKGVAEATTLLENKELSSVEIKKKLPAIKSIYNMTVLELVTDTKSDTKETDHIHGEINPKKDSAGAEKDTGDWPVKIEDKIKNTKLSNHAEKVLNTTPEYIKYTQSSSIKNPGTVQSTRQSFMEDWNAGLIYKTSELTVPEKRADLETKFPGKDKVVDAIMNRDDLREKIVVSSSEEAHHIVPIEILRKNEKIQELVQEGGFKFNEEINGIALEKGFHGTHPAYTNYVFTKIETWVDENGSFTIDALKSYIQGQLRDHLIEKMDDAKKQFQEKGTSLNDYFKNL
jgi:hypothetical protein